MKKRIFLIPIVGVMLLNGLWAKSSYDTFDRLSREDEATIAACNFVSRDRNTFSDNYNEETVNEEEALLRDWLRYPSHDFKSIADSAASNPKKFEYRSALCEESLHRIIMDMGGGTRFLGPRCEALAADNEFFLPEYKGKKNNYLEARKETTPVTAAERFWCNGKARTDLVLIACESRKVKRDAYNQNSSAYKTALSALKRRCEPYIGNAGRSRGLASNDPLVDNGPFLDRGGGGHSGGSYVPGGAAYSPMVIPRYIPVPSGQWGGCQQGRGLNVINYQPSITHSITSGLVAGLGAYLNYDGQKRADEYKYKLLNNNMLINAKLGAATMLGVGGPWGQGSMYPMPGGAPGWPGGPGGMGGPCGRPPYNTGHTGCMGGMPGMPPMAGGPCPGPGCGGGMIGGGCSPGMPCFGGGGGMGGCQPGMPCMGGGPGGCSGGGCNPNYPGNYMMNPAMQGRPDGMYNYGHNPYNLDQEQARIRQMQDQLNRQIEDAKRAQAYNNQLRDLQNQMNSLNGRYGTALNGYNGIMANQFGPSGYGNPGAYQGPGMRPGGPGGCPPGMPNCGMGGGGGCQGGGMGPGCVCSSPICYPGQQSAYYAPPYVYGNSGMGGPQYGYPDTNRNFFGMSLRWTARPVKTGILNAR